MKVYIVVTLNVGDPDEIVDIVSVHKSAASAEQKIESVLKDQQHDEDLHARYNISNEWNEINYIIKTVED